MSRVVLFPYKMGSNSAKELSKRIGIVRVFPDGKYRPRKTDTIINWGNATLPEWNIDNAALILNHPDRVAEANDKLSAFRRFDEQGIPTIDWTTNHDVAKKWFELGEVVMARDLARASGGRGITVCNPHPREGEETNGLIQAKFYSRFQTHKREFRVHVFQGKAFLTARKRRLNTDEMERRGLTVPHPNARCFIRNHEAGYIYSTELGMIFPQTTELAVKAVTSLGLDFGAVDVIESDKYGSFILEINTAPGLEGRTLDAYVTELTTLTERKK